MTAAPAESGESDQVIMSIAGHVSKKMLEHYSHIRLAAKRRALEALETPPHQSKDAPLERESGRVN
jgi:hypothetical protein